MKIKIKTLRGTHFEIDVKPEDTVADVKKNIETVKGPDVYPSAQQMLIHQGQVLKDATTLAENKVAENSFFVIMLSKSKSAASRLSTTSSVPTHVDQPSPASPSTPNVTPSEPATQSIDTPVSVLVPSLTLEETTLVIAAASNLAVAGSGSESSLRQNANSLETIMQQIVELGRGRWDRETFIRAFCAASNDPKRIVDYLYSGIPEEAEVSPVLRSLIEQAMNPPASLQPAAPAAGPNANPLNLFPQVLTNMGSNESDNVLDFLRDSQQFQVLRALVHSRPHILQPVLQELRKQNPNLMWLIDRHRTEFLRLIFDQPLAGEQNFPRQIQITGRVPDNFSMTADEFRAVSRLEAMGFDRSLALEVFLACDKNEVVAANYLLHYMQFEDESEE